MTRRRFGDRILPLLAIALLGSLALAPTHTLADGSGDGNGASQGQHGSGPDNGGHGDGHHDDGHHDDAAHRGQPSNHAGRGASTDCAEWRGDGGRNCGDHGSLGVGRKGLVPSAAAPGASASAPGRVAGAPSSATSRGSSSASGSAAASTGSASAATRVASSARGIALVQGVNLPGVAVPVSRPPASNPAPIRPPLATPATSVTAPPHPVLGPVPVLVPSIGVTVAPATSALGWEWLVALAIVGVILGVALLARRRRAGAGPL